MLRDPKIRIQKRVLLDNKGHFRFYPASGKGTKDPIIRLENHPEFKTEKDLVWYIYKMFGEGEYLLFCHAKGVSGLWTFWKGEINKEGFIFYPKHYNKKEINEWQKEINKEKDKDTIETLKEIKEETRKEEIERNKKRRYGFQPFLKRSGNRGEFRFWDDDDLILKPDEDETKENKQWKKEEKDNLEVWGETDKSEELEEW